MTYYLSAEQVGALRIQTDHTTLRAALRKARTTRHMPPPSWTGPWIRLTLHNERGAVVRVWEYLAGAWTRCD